MHTLLELSPLLFALAFGYAFDAWQAERERRKLAESERDWHKEDARQVWSRCKESDTILVEMANAVGELGRSLCAWNAAARADGFTMQNLDEGPLERANGVLERFQLYAKRNGVQKGSAK